MMDAWRQKVYDALCSKQGQATFNEFEFFTDSFKPLEARDYQIIEKNKKTASYAAIGGACLGFSLTLAFRRYMPKYRYSLSFLRIMTEFTFVSGVMIYSLYSFGVPRFISQIKDFREELVLKNDYQYLHFLKDKYHRYPEVYPKEMLIFRDFMSEDNFVKWYSDHPQYKFDKGQEPKAEDFSSKEVFKGLTDAISTWEHRLPEEGKSKPPSK